MNPLPAPAKRRAHACFGLTALACLVVFAWMVTYGTFDFVEEDSFGSFYDHQAAAWLHARWDVPEPALSGEAFIVDCKVYGYFGPTPALMRLPLVMLGVGFAQVTRLFMVIDYAACLAAAYALLGLVVRWRDANAVAPGRVSIVLLSATVGLGSTLFFLGSRAYVYHEAILCGAAFGLWSTYCALRYWREPASRWWAGALICGVLAVQARAPIGLFALSLLGCVAAAHLVRGWLAREGASSDRLPAGSYHRHVAIGVLSALGIFSFNLVSLIKFGTIEGCPLRFNVQYTPEKLAVLEHRNFHLSNLRFSADAYWLRPIFSVRREFPYVYREYTDRREYPESRMAYRDPVMAIPWSMPGLFVLAFGGSALAAAGVPAFRRPLALLWIAALPAALALLAAVAVTQRYTADFLPFMIAAAAFGTAAMETLALRLRRLVTGAITIFAVSGILVTFALTLHHQRHVVWGVPEGVQREYQRWQAQVDNFFHRRTERELP